jgi:hypothetical protein
MTIQKLFGDSAKLNETLAEEDINVRFKLHCRRYRDVLKQKYMEAGQQDNCQEQNFAGSLYTSAMAFKVDKTETTNDTLFFMVLATTSLSVLNSFKFSTQSLTQQGSESAFTDFYHNNNYPPPAPGRKTDDEEEADNIYQEFRGQQNVLLGEVKRYVIEETPYPFHARVLRVLEEDGRLSEVQSVDAGGQPMTRSRKEFCYKISNHPEDPDVAGKKFGNFWLLSFRD